MLQRSLQFIKRLFGNAARVLVYSLILSLVLPLPVLAEAAARDADDGAAHVLQRLNSPERRAAIAEAAHKDAQMQAAATAEESRITENFPLHNGDQGDSIPLKGSRAQNPVATAGVSKPAPASPRPLSSVMTEHAAALLGVPAPMGTHQDEGLGFHQDGTVRKAGGNNSNFTPDGKRAAAYSQYGFSQGYSRGLNEPSYDPITGFNYRIGDSTAGGRISGSNSMGRTSNQFDPARTVMDRGLSYGLGWANSAGEAALSSLVDGGRARLNFMVDWNGRINGEGDTLLPFYDSQYTTVYTQFGARSMSGLSGRSSDDDGSGADRWIGNAGVGQRWFPTAENLADSGNWMFGYNAFYDYDFTRSHQRGGVGVEAQYDWLRVASNYYMPISSWRSSKDFDGDFVKERAAEGWDVRVKGYLPFYRNMAVTGAYSQWQGDHVGMFSSDKLEKDPKVWSYGLEYTPVPLVSGFVNQRSTEQSRSDTEFGLRFTYHFQMPWEEQISHSKVAELRTVGGSRHEFVDRENRIILEYKTKNSYRITYVGQDGENRFRFRVTNGFGEYMVGQTVRVTAGGMTLAEATTPAPLASTTSDTFLSRAGKFFDALFSVREAQAADFSRNYTTNGRGEFVVTVINAPGGPLVLTMQAGENTQSFTVLTTATLKISASSTSLANSGQSTLTVQAQPGQDVVWTISGPGMFTSQQNQTNSQGLATAIMQANPTGYGDIRVTATVNGRPIHVTLTVPQVYTLEAAPSSLTQGSASSMTFTVKMNGAPAPAGTAVTFTPNANFTGLPTTALTTDAAGKTTVTGLTVTVSGNQTLSATVAGQTIRIPITITSAAYTLEATPSSLTQGSASSVTFTVKMNGAPAPARTAVTFTPNANFTGLPTGAQSTNASGQIVVSNLTGTTSGSQTITATVAGNTVTASITVSSATYTLEATPNSLSQGLASSVTFTVKMNGAPAPAGTAVTFTPNANFTGLPTGAQSTNASGQIVVSNLTGTTSGSQTITATVTGQTVSVPITVANTYAITFPSVAAVGGFVSGKSTAALTARVTNGGVAVNGATVTWSIQTVNNSANLAVIHNDARGLAWGGSATTTPTAALSTTTTSSTAGAGDASVQMTDILGERTITVRATVTLDGTPYTADQAVTFGAGPLGVLRLPSPGSTGPKKWANVAPISGATSFPAAELCGGSGDTSWTTGDYSLQTKLPTVNELRAVTKGMGGNSAGIAAGWQNSDYWTGQVSGSNNVVRIVNIRDGMPGDGVVDITIGVVCRR